MPRCAALCRAVPCCAALCRAVCAYSAATLCDLVAVVGEWVGRDAQPHSELTVKAVAMRARRTRRTTPQQPKATFMVVPVGAAHVVVTQRAATPCAAGRFTRGGMHPPNLNATSASSVYRFVHKDTPVPAGNQYSHRCPMLEPVVVVQET